MDIYSIMNTRYNAAISKSSAAQQYSTKQSSNEMVSGQYQDSVTISDKAALMSAQENNKAIIELNGIVINDMFSDDENIAFNEVYGKAGMGNIQTNESGTLMPDPLKTRLALDKYMAEKNGTEIPELNLEYVQSLVDEMDRLGEVSGIDANILSLAMEYFKSS